MSLKSNGTSFAAPLYMSYKINKEQAIEQSKYIQPTTTTYYDDGLSR